MSRLSLFNSPLLLGFDHFERTLDRIAKSGAEGYPPYNIEQIGPLSLRITLAVAGFRSDEIDITAQQNLLIVSGQKKVDGNDNRDFLHLGIANRNFERRFQLADHVFVRGADLADGLLIVQLERQVPEELKPRKVLIGGTTPTVIENGDAKKKGGKAA